MPWLKATHPNDNNTGAAWGSALATTIRGSIRNPVPCGYATTYYAICGPVAALAGTYQRRRPGTTRQTLQYRPKAEVPIIAIRRGRANNPQTEAQQANRAKFAAGMAAWKALTVEEKSPYIQVAKRLKQFPHVYFLKTYLQTH